MAKYGYLKGEAAYLGWLRSALRKVWSKHPVKIALLEHKRKKMPSGNRLIFKVPCNKCGNYFKMSEVEVNHKVQVGKGLTLDSIGDFAQKLLVIKEEDIEILCIPCHAITTYSERYGVSEEDAAIEKKVIAFMKKGADVQKQGLLKVGIEPAKTTAGRKAQARDYLKRKYNASKTTK